MESEILELKVENAELRKLIAELSERVTVLENRESGSGIFIEGVAPGFREYIQKELGGK